MGGEDGTEKARPSSAIAALDACPPELLPNINKLLQILATLPVTTAEPERLFSRVSLAETCIRATMSEERLEALRLLQVYRQCPALTVDSVLQQLATSQRKLNLIF